MKYTDGDFQYATPPRIMGSETEYTTRYTQSVLNLSSRMDQRLQLHESPYDNIWLKNGGRLYSDFGKLIEYATPECTNAHSVLLYERAGESIVRNLGDSIERSDDPLDGAITFQPSPIYKRTGYSEVKIDDRVVLYPMSAGHHENYRVGFDEDELKPESGSTKRRSLNTYLATRTIWSGAGLVVPNGYSVSQKAEAIDFLTGDSPTEHGKKVPYQIQNENRLEIRTGEGNMSDWAVVQKFAFTSLVLRLLEHDAFPQHVLLATPADEQLAMQRVAQDPQAVLNTECGPLDALQIQSDIARACLAFAHKFKDTPREEVAAARQILEICEDLEAFWRGEAELSAISDRLDWAAKLDRMQQRGIELGSISCKNTVAVFHDLSWEDIDKDSPSRRWYRRRQAALFSPQDIERATYSAPMTRAMARTAWVKANLDEVTQMDWHIISTAGKGKKLFSDPYQSADASSTAVS